ncbi:hypothetical protein DYB35_013471 [Aphanomyces astaci]|uniref:Uncharacterized protein n=1 Tax=Aphanomyces astaci TaxID=112090 RepID=A0A3R7BUK7_APHAT|nr:hypothetical protein DYB35_013471 [Aphanomyces astaci]
MHEPLALLPAVRSDDELYQLDMQAPDDHESITFLERMQCTLPGTMVEERTNNTRLLHTNTPDGAFVNSLQGHFHEADRFIVVIRQVEHDEVHVCGPVLRQRHYRSWMEVRQVSPTHIIMRTVGHLSRVFRARDGFVSTTELAVLRGIDLTGIQDDQKDAYVWREFIRRGNAHFVSWRRRLTALMQEASQHHHDNHLTSK